MTFSLFVEKHREALEGPREGCANEWLLLNLGSSLISPCYCEYPSRFDRIGRLNV